MFETELVLSPAFPGYGTQADGWKFPKTCLDTAGQSACFAGFPMTPLLKRASLRAVLFDLDGTLVDQFEAIRLGCAAVAAHLGRPEPTLADIKGAVGGALPNTLARLFGEGAAAVGESIYVQEFGRVWQTGLLALPAAEETLRHCRRQGFKTALFTNKRTAPSRDVLNHFGWLPLFDLVQGTGSTAFRKPDPEYAQQALDALGVTPDQAIVVGDSPFDIAAAHSVGMACLTVATGSHSQAELREIPHAGTFAHLAELQAQL